MNRLIITGFVELLFCLVIPLMKPLDGEDPNLFAIDWADLNRVDKFTLVYGLTLLGIFIAMTVTYIVVIVILAPKLHKTESA